MSTDLAFALLDENSALLLCICLYGMERGKNSPIKQSVWHIFSKQKKKKTKETVIMMNLTILRLVFFSLFLTEPKLSLKGLFYIPLCFFVR